MLGRARPEQFTGRCTLWQNSQSLPRSARIRDSESSGGHLKQKAFRRPRPTHKLFSSLTHADKGYWPRRRGILAYSDSREPFS